MKNEVNTERENRLDLEIERVMRALAEATPNAYKRRLTIQISDAEYEPIGWMAQIVPIKGDTVFTGFYNSPEELLEELRKKKQEIVLLREKAEKLLKQAEELENLDL